MESELSDLPLLPPFLDIDPRHYARVEALTAYVNQEDVDGQSLRNLVESNLEAITQNKHELRNDLIT